MHPANAHPSSHRLALGAAVAVCDHGNVVAEGSLSLCQFVDVAAEAKDILGRVFAREVEYAHGANPRGARSAQHRSQLFIADSCPVSIDFVVEFLLKSDCRISVNPIIVTRGPAAVPCAMGMYATYGGWGPGARGSDVDEGRKLPRPLVPAREGGVPWRNFVEFRY